MKKTLILGIGGCGKNLIKNIKVTESNKKLTINTTDADINIGENESIEKAILEHKKEIMDQLNSFDKIFIFTGLGGKTGTGATLEIIKMTKNKPFIFATLPFNLERKRKEITKEAIKEIEKHSNVILFDNNLLIKMYPTKSLKDAFEKVNSIASKIIELDFKGISYLEVCENGIFENDGFSYCLN